MNLVFLTHWRISMKKLISTLTLALFISAGIPSAMAHMNHGQPQYGGVVGEAVEAQFELVAKDDKVTVYASLHGSALDTAGATGKLTVLSGSNKTELTLKPAGDNRMESKGKIASGAKVLIQIQLAGKKSLQARVVMP